MAPFKSNLACIVFSLASLAMALVIMSSTIPSSNALAPWTCNNVVGQCEIGECANSCRRTGLRNYGARCKDDVHPEQCCCKHHLHP
ncbi:hypothetical protein ACP70R_008745 [Stipagrostis hirtigluma subsp. patula]